MGEELAIFSAQEIHDKKHALKRAWESYVSESEITSCLRPSIVASWKRSQSFGVQPELKQARFLHPEDDVIHWRKQSDFFLTAIPVLEDVYEQIKATNHLLTLTDAQGRIVYLQGVRAVLDKAEKMRFIIGADWSEQSAGTNAIGTSVYLQKPIQIFSYEHFAQGAHDWVCSAAPITDPHTGRLLGVVDLTAPYQHAQPHTLATAKMIALHIEKEYRRISDDLYKLLMEQYNKARKRHPQKPIMIFNAAFQLIVQNQHAQAWLHDIQQRMPHLSIHAIIREALLNYSDIEFAFELSDLGYEAHVKSLIWKNELIGFLVILHKRSRGRPPTHHLELGNLKNSHHNPWQKIIGLSPSIQTVVERGKIVASTNASVLITGESGTGKELFARAIHESSPRRHKPFVAVNIGAIPRELIASELFGYEPGAFTGAHPKGARGKFEEAEGGTIFLDEIGSMTIEAQVYLLRVLQERKIMRLGSTKTRPINVRIIAATNEDLLQRVAEGAFRLDLFYRLNVVQLTLPPLRERVGDITTLAEFFLSTFARQYGKDVRSFSPEVIQVLESYSWPGNVRELQNVIEHAVIFSTSNKIEPSNLPSYLLSAQAEPSVPPVTSPATFIEPDFDPLEQEEKKMIAYWLKKTDGNISEVARRLNRSRSTIYRRIKKYSLDRLINN